MALSYSELRSGIFFIYEGQPYVVLSSNQLKMQQRRPVYQTRMRNLLNGKIIEHNFQQSDQLQEADIKKRVVRYLYHHRGQYWFNEINDPSKRFQLEENAIGNTAGFFKPNTEVEVLSWNEKVINVELPIKMDFKVTEAPPAVRGNTAQGGVKQVKIETGATINVPLFINEGDTIRINTQTGEYAERAGK